MCIHIHLPLLVLMQFAASNGAFPETEESERCDDVLGHIFPSQGDDESDLGVSLLQRRAEVIEKLASFPKVGLNSRSTKASGTFIHLSSKSFADVTATHPLLTTAIVAMLSVFFGFLVYVGLIITGHSFVDECLTDPAMGGTLKGASVVDSATDGEVGATVNETAITLSKMMLGLGFIGLPKAVCSGWLTSPILFMLAAFINGYTTQLIGSLMEITKPKALELGNHAPDLAFCGLVAFGEKSRACFSAFIIGGIWMVLIWALLLSTYFVTSLFPGFGRTQGVIFSAVVFFLTTLAPLSWFARFSFCGILSLLVIVGSLLWCGGSMKNYGINVYPVDWMGWDDIPLSLGVFQSILGGLQVCLPNIYRAMSPASGKDAPAVGASKLRRAIALGIGLGTSIAMFVCLYGFVLYGTHAQTSFTDNIGREANLSIIPGLAFLPNVCNICLIVSVVTSAPIIASPLIDASESVLGLGNSPWSLRTLWKAFIFTSSGVACQYLEGYLYASQALVGTVFVSVCVIWPTMCSLKLLTFGSATKVFLWMILFYGLFILTWGTYCVIKTSG